MFGRKRKQTKAMLWHAAAVNTLLGLIDAGLAPDEIPDLFYEDAGYKKTDFVEAMSCPS